MASTLSLSPLSISSLTTIPHPPPLPTSSQLVINKPPISDAANTDTNTPFPFLLLPLELRLKIYGLINHTPRTVSIAYKTVFHRTPEPKVFPVTYESARPRDEEEGGQPQPQTQPRQNLGHAARAGVRTRGSNLKGIKTPRFTSRWVTSSPSPILLSLSHESREEALKAYRLAFGSIEAPATIYFNFAVDTLHFQGFSAYQLDLFLGGDVYGGCDADIGMVRALRLDVPEELYGRRSFCWGDIRGFTNLQEVILVVQEGIETEMAQKTRLMPFYERSLKRVWDAYVEGEGEGVESIGGKWVVPKITVWDDLRNIEWGTVKFVLDV